VVSSVKEPSTGEIRVYRAYEINEKNEMQIQMDDFFVC